MAGNEFAVVDFTNSKVVKQGMLEEGGEATKQILDGLPNGHYVVYLNGTSKQYVKSD
ncbi:MAG: hypothetical protein KF763_03070 [Cyclobacteriaceae bacterium]|nr:hypothetical protein [Cyclobacteriaceae bacterium]